MSEQETLNCPFCGHKLRLRDGGFKLQVFWRYYCQKCQFRSPEYKCRKDLNNLIKRIHVAER